MGMGAVWILYCYLASMYLVSSLTSDGEVLLLLLKNLTVPQSLESSWNSSNSTPCYWQGIECDLKQNVISLNISKLGVSGELAPEISSLTYLKKIDLSTNSLSGVIPKELGNSILLEHLDLSNNQLSGIIPQSIGNCTKLEELHLEDNQLKGEIPISIWRIPALEILLVHNNNLTGQLPLEMVELRQLRNISLFNNHFFGVIPRTLGINSSLELLDFSNNSFSGELPSNMCSRKRLRVLDMGLNLLRGSIPSDVGSCSSLKRLILKHNNLTGFLPDFSENTNLLFMDISGNNVNGKIPSSLGNCTNLTSVDLSVNKLTGLITQGIGNLVHLEVLNLSKNHLQGRLPPQISNCKKLYLLDVGFNALNGSIPLTLRNLTKLSILVLRENQFNGGIPSFLSECNQLLELQLGGNLFGGTIPQSLGDLPYLFYALNVSGNRLTGQIPWNLGRLGMLQNLDVSCNNLTGSLKVVDVLGSLFNVNVSFNHFTGQIPDKLMKLLDSSPSSFLGNQNLCVPCSLESGSTCSDNSIFRLCTNQLTVEKGPGNRYIALMATGLCIFFILELLLLGYMVLSARKLWPIPRYFQENPFSLSNGFFKRISFSLYDGFPEGSSPLLLKKVMQATENLQEKYVIGRGAHGTVYKARLISGQMYAVKKLQFAAEKGARASMVKEIQTVGRIRHLNLVRVEDFWLRPGYGLIMYKYYENGSLYDVLHETSPSPILKWDMRSRIALGVAQGLSYLHDDCNPAIVHQDIKPKNILLDSEMEPRISDFGAAKLLNQSSDTFESIASSIYTIMVVGTAGYIAPETAYSMTKNKKTDVYSYGVVLLELITRKKAVDHSFPDDMDIVKWVQSVWSSTKAINSIVDPSLVDELKEFGVMAEVINVLLLALKCTDRNSSLRPSMNDVVKVLERIKTTR